MSDITEKLQRAAGVLLTVNDRSGFDLSPTCKLLKEAHDEIKLERERAKDYEALAAELVTTLDDLAAAYGLTPARWSAHKAKEKLNALKLNSD